MQQSSCNTSRIVKGAKKGSRRRYVKNFTIFFIIQISQNKCDSLWKSEKKTPFVYCIKDFLKIINNITRSVSFQ